MKIAIYTSDPFLYQKIYLILGKDETVLPYSGESSSFDLLITDGRSDDKIRSVYMSRTGVCDLPIPFSEQDLRLAVYGPKKRVAAIRLGERCIYLKERKIMLTELEFSLFKELFEAGGEYVTRESLIEAVWGSGYTNGILNVYIHYLREKLETEGEKIILSSRNQGYKIDERYLKICSES